MSEKNKEKPLPQIILQDTRRDSTDGMVIRELYVSIQAQENTTELLNKAKKTLREMKE